MISPDQLRRINTVFYHASCPDGSASAVLCALAFRILNHEVEFKPLQYGTEEMDKMLPDSGQLFVDITPPRERWQEWESFYPIVLDHHESSKHVTEGLGGIYGTNDKYSGAMLAYEHIYLPCFEEYIKIGRRNGNGSLWETAFREGSLEPWRQFAELAMIRDTWKNTHALWNQAHALMLASSFEGSKGMLAMVENDSFNPFKFLEFGERLLEKHNRKVELTADHAYSITIEYGDKPPCKMAIFNTTEKTISDVGNLLLERGADVAVGYFFTYEDGDTHAVVSLRTRESYSASKICEALGGGGHARAAGFKIKNALDVSPNLILETVYGAILRSARE